MNWGSAGEFFAMGGYGFYVWGAYGVAAVAIGAELWLLVRWRRTLLLRLGRSLGGRGTRRAGAQSATRGE